MEVESAAPRGTVLGRQDEVNREITISVRERL